MLRGNVVRERLGVVQRTPEWHALRRARMNASELSTALGLFAWMQPFRRVRLWEEKLFQDCPPYPVTKDMQNGIDNEDAVCKHYSEISGNAVSMGNYWIARDHHFQDSWIGCSPDGVVADRETLLEVKCPINKPPAQFNYLYIPQVMGQLYVTGRSTCHFVNWHPKRITYFKVHYDKNWTENILIPQIAEFWSQHVLPARRWIHENPDRMPTFEQYHNGHSEIAKFRPSMRVLNATELAQQCRDLASRRVEYIESSSDKEAFLGFFCTKENIK